MIVGVATGTYLASRRGVRWGPAFAAGLGVELAVWVLIGVVSRAVTAAYFARLREQSHLGSGLVALLKPRRHL